MTAYPNNLIDLLPARDRARLLALCVPVKLLLGEVLWELGEPIRHVYFPTDDAFVSLVTRIDTHPGVEVGMVGREGMLGAPIVLGGAAAPNHAVVQGAGPALRIGVAAFRRELAASKPLQRILLSYVTVLMSQLTRSAGCLRVHKVGPRLARWLLMTHDRAGVNTFRITHAFLAYMLGVRRVGITHAASSLQQGSLIEYFRGQITIRDRGGLEAAACSCYAADCLAYTQLIKRG